MELKHTCKILLQKEIKKVKCFKFKSSELDRELAIHEHADHKNKSSITDVVTGLCLTSIDEPTKKVTETSLKEALDQFIRHFSIDLIKEQLRKAEETTMEEKLK